MSLILNIDTALAIACVSIAKDGEIIEVAFNHDQKEHGSFLQPAIQSMLKNTTILIQELDAIAITAGPGSYTGLRVGMASAKGLCYGLNKPLITVSSLEVLAFSAMLDPENNALSFDTWLCPMIDARRMEVFTAIYNNQLIAVLEPTALILDENSFANMLLKNRIQFFGNGAQKWKLISNNKNAAFGEVISNPLAMSRLAYKKYKCGELADLAYSVPAYLKEFFAGPSSQ